MFLSVSNTNCSVWTVGMQPDNFEAGKLKIVCLATKTIYYENGYYSNHQTIMR